MKKLILLIFLIPLMVNAVPSAKIVTELCWSEVTTNTIGEPMTVDGYKLFYRQSLLESYDNVRSVTINSPAGGCYQINNLSLSDGMYYVSMTAFLGLAESQYSNEVNFTIQSGLAQVGEGMPLNTIPAAPGLQVK